MPRYLLTHHVNRIRSSQDELINDIKGLRRRCPPETQWRTSLYAAGSNRLYCEWEAASPDAIRACFQAEDLEMLPIENIDEVIFIDPAWVDSGSR